MIEHSTKELVLSKLKEIQELFSDDKRFTQKRFARNEFGEDVPVFHDSACCWCLDGAITKVAPTNGNVPWDKELCNQIRFALMPELCSEGADMFSMIENIRNKIANLNDFRGLDGVRELLSERIAALS